MPLALDEGRQRRQALLEPARAGDLRPGCGGRPRGGELLALLDADRRQQVLLFLVR
ncbi:hypothetical protein PUR71_14245 [Streptomyces sp. SP17BM10]|uniref:hypothetical protein n=1 Tax=Streptomyces sp. SP17BM10 TaxID=3002530 RepID=UPI002E79D90E|nr:hypothetical protein [Streptomyces sp. SP17BM10]MEE1784049.1 hypothetical protein [Streptomyces sp. SP17BM10]